MLDQIKALEPFKELDGTALAAVARHASWLRLPAGRLLRRRGQTLARELYLVAGTVADEGDRRLHARDAGGRPLSELFDAATAITTVTAAKLIAVDLPPVQLLLNAARPQAPTVAGIEDWMRALLRGPVMRWFSPGAWAQVLRRGRMRQVEAGERIVRRGEVCPGVYVIARGTAVAGAERFGPGDFFGEASALGNAPAACDVTMATAGALVCFAREDLLALAANYEPPRLQPPPRRIDLDAVPVADEANLLAALPTGPAIAVRCSDPARRLTVATRLMREGHHVV